jgi:hypothetical protein
VQALHRPSAGGSQDGVVIAGLVQSLQSSVDRLQKTMLAAFENATTHGFPSVCVLLPNGVATLSQEDKSAR